VGQHGHAFLASLYGMDPVAVKCGANLGTLHGLEYAAGEGTQEREEWRERQHEEWEGTAAQGMISVAFFAEF